MSNRLIGRSIALVVLAALVVSSALVIYFMDTRPRTDDAFLLAYVANIAPEVSGRIVSVQVRDNQNVRAGDVLFVIVPDPFRFKLEAAKAQATVAASTYARMEPLLGRGYVTADKLDQARAAKESSLANEGLADYDFRQSTVRAPFDGKVVGLNTANGEYANTGRPLFTMIDTSRWYVIANFRETEVNDMKVGTDATVYVMADRSRALRGHVDSVGWGVTPEEGQVVNGLPRIPKTLNWVRLAQRFPVRILLDHPPDDLMRIGATAVVVVHHGTHR
ncbi:MAG: efflux RND transporter periplasmic adaptor subunit [Oligoflexia bacterium]|nr:efflux RND transporter periplasmic adaptor subunit [Oligoflexia bacterium]